MARPGAEVNGTRQKVASGVKCGRFRGFRVVDTAR